MAEEMAGKGAQGSVRSFLAALLASSLLAAVVSSVVSVYQVQAARNDNRTALERQSLVDLRGSLIDLVNAAKDVYLVDLRHFLETNEWKNHIDLKAEQKVGYGNTKVGVYRATINDPELAEHLQAVRVEVAHLVDSTSRAQAEQAAHSMDQDTEAASARIGVLLGPLLKG